MLQETKTHRILKFILYLSNSYPKSKRECISFLEIKDSAFYDYCKILREIGFDLTQKRGLYNLDYNDKDHLVLKSILHFTEEENYLLSKAIDNLGESTAALSGLKHKLISFLNHDKPIELYLRKEKKEKALKLNDALKAKKQVMLNDYASGNSQTVSNRIVEPFSFSDDFNLVWAFDTGIKENRQFKTSRIKEVVITPLPWEYQRFHRAMPVDIFRNTGELTKEIIIEMNLRARNLLIEEYPLSEKNLEEKECKWFLLKVNVAKYEGPGRFCMGLPEDTEVMGDEGFREYLRKKLKVGILKIK